MGPSPWNWCLRRAFCTVAADEERLEWIFLVLLLICAECTVVGAEGAMVGLSNSNDLSIRNNNGKGEHMN